MDMVSIVVPVYNAEKYVERTISSVIGQTWTKWELLLVDDCSTDGSREILRRYESDKIHCYYCEQNAGPANARNIGVSHAKGRYLAYVDADDLWKPEKLARQMAFMQAGGYAFTFTSYEFADENARPSGVVNHAPASVDYRSLLKSSTIAPSTIILDRSQIDAVLLQMPSGIDREDYAMLFQILKTGITAYGLDEILTIYCRHEGARSGNKWKAVLGKWQLYRTVEGFSVPESLYYVAASTWAAVKRRV